MNRTKNSIELHNYQHCAKVNIISRQICYSHLYAETRDSSSSSNSISSSSSSNNNSNNDNNNNNNNNSSILRLNMSAACDNPDAMFKLPKQLCSLNDTNFDFFSFTNLSAFKRSLRSFSQFLQVYKCTTRTFACVVAF